MSTLTVETPWTPGAGGFSSEQISSLRQTITWDRQTLPISSFKCPECLKEEIHGIDSEDPEDQGKRREESTTYWFRLLSVVEENNGLGSMLRLSFVCNASPRCCNHGSLSDEELRKRLPSASEALSAAKQAIYRGEV